MTVRAAAVDAPRPGADAGPAFGIYVHVPFCATRCGYCDFNTYTPAELGGANPDGWLAALRAGAGAGRRRAGVRRRRSTRCSSAAARRRCSAVPGSDRGARRGPRALRAGSRRRGHHRGEPGVDVAAVLRAVAGGRLHPGVAGHAVGGPARAGRARPGALAGPGARRRRARRARPASSTSTST